MEKDNPYHTNHEGIDRGNPNFIKKEVRQMLEFVKVAAPLLAIVSFVLICLGFTKLGKMKVFHFTLGEISLVTAIAYAFQTAFAVSWFAPYGIAIWFFIGSLNFAQATWLDTH